MHWMPQILFDRSGLVWTWSDRLVTANAQGPVVQGLLQLLEIDVLYTRDFRGVRQMAEGQLKFEFMGAFAVRLLVIEK